MACDVGYGEPDGGAGPLRLRVHRVPATREVPDDHQLPAFGGADVNRNRRHLRGHCARRRGKTMRVWKATIATSWSAT